MTSPVEKWVRSSVLYSSVGVNSVVFDMLGKSAEYGDDVVIVALME